jgi:hypothetical protein
MVRLFQSIAIPALSIVAVLALGTSPALAQAPKVGSKPYVDTSDLGFKIKVPDGWDLIPPAPDDVNVIAKYDPPINKYITLGPDAQAFFIHCWLIKFDRRKHDEAESKGPKRFSKPAKDIQDWMKSNVEFGPKLKLDSQKDFTNDKIAATEYHWVSPDDPKVAVHYYAAVYKVSPEVDVGIVFNGPGDPKKWVKWEGPITQMGRSLSLKDLKEVASATPTGDTLRDKKRAELNKDLAKLPGWKLYETPHYFIVTPHEDKAFRDELMKRLEAIHAIYEQDYPAAKAEEFRKIGEAAKTGDQKTPEEKERDKALKDFFTDGADPQEMAKCSVVRVFTDKSAYHSYGGPGASAGYWSPSDRELVLYDDQAGGGRNDTWSVLNHEAFHQYIFYFYGNIAPHSWYNEGTGDFYSGYAWKTNKFVLEKFQWRIGTIKEAIQQKAYVPLDKFVKLSQPDYYGGATKTWPKADGGQNYAQGWSLIYFLRTGKKNNAKGWVPAWDTILETYLRVLATSGKVDQAVDAAFQGVDFAALEAAWADYTK